MTRKGSIPISVPTGVEVNISNSMISVKGPKGFLEQALMEGIHVALEDGCILVTRPDKDQDKKKFHGLYWSLINNMVQGTTKGFEKKLQMIGVGYRASVQERKLILQVGFSHPTEVDIPEGIEVKVDKNTEITISGIDTQRVGQYAAKIRAIRPPEPFQGKGIRYNGEYVRKKAGKTGGKK